MKIYLSVCLALLISVNVTAQKVNTDALLGMWLTESGKAVVLIYKEGSKYNGKINWLKTPTYEDGKAKVDKHNPDVKLQSTPLMGLNLLKDFIFNGEKWEKGTIYDPDNGKTYSCKITMINEAKIEVRGFIGFSLLGRTQTWVKLPDKK